MSNWTHERQNRPSRTHEWICVLALFLFLVLCASLAFGQVVRVDVHHGNMRSVGSGVVFAQQDGAALVATCSHGIDEGGRIVVHVPDVGEYPARVVHSEPKDSMEWTVLEFRGPKLKTLPLATRQPQRGERVRIYGFPGAGPLSKYDAQIDSVGKVSMTQGGVRLATASVSVAQGTSGGPVLAENGDVLGIVWGADGRQSYITPSAVGRKVTLAAYNAGACQWFPCPGGTCINPSPVQSLPPGQSPATNRQVGDGGWLSREHWDESIATIDGNFRKHRKDINANRDAIASLEQRTVAIKGAKGDKGDKGEPGERGPAGPPGKDATPADLSQIKADIAALQKQVTEIEKRPQWFNYQALDHNGNPYKQQVKVPLGKTLGVYPDAVDMKARVE